MRILLHMINTSQSTNVIHKVNGKSNK